MFHHKAQCFFLSTSLQTYANRTGVWSYTPITRYQLQLWVIGVLLFLLYSTTSIVTQPFIFPLLYKGSLEFPTTSLPCFIISYNEPLLSLSTLCVSQDLYHYKSPPIPLKDFSISYSERAQYLYRIALRSFIQVNNIFVKEQYTSKKHPTSKGIH